MTIGEEKEYHGTMYTAVRWNGVPSDFRPSEDDPQCKLCAVSPTYCKMMDDCHGSVAFIFVQKRYIKALATLNQ